VALVSSFEIIEQGKLGLSWTEIRLAMDAELML
jgi:hypothetical protein